MSLLSSKNKSYRISKELLERIVEKAEERSIELLPQCSTDEIMSIIAVLLESKRNLTNVNSFFKEISERNLSPEEITRLVFIISENREHNNSSLNREMLKLLEDRAKQLPRSAYFLFLMSKLELDIGYPRFELPEFIRDLLQEQCNRIPDLNFEEGVYLLFALRFVSDWHYDDQIKQLLHQLYRQIDRSGDQFEFVRILVQLTLSLNNDRGFIVTEENLNRVIDALENCDKEDLIWKCIAEFNELHMPAKEKVVERLNKVLLLRYRSSWPSWKDPPRTSGAAYASWSTSPSRASNPSASPTSSTR